MAASPYWTTPGRIGEAANPGPSVDEPAALQVVTGKLEPEPLRVSLAQLLKPKSALSTMLAALAFWHEAMGQRRVACEQTSYCGWNEFC